MGGLFVRISKKQMVFDCCLKGFPKLARTVRIHMLHRPVLLLTFISYSLLPGEEQQLPKVPEPEAPIDSAECRLNLLDHLIHYQTLIDARLSCIESLVAGKRE